MCRNKNGDDCHDMVEFEYFIENERNDQSSLFKKMVEKQLHCICVLLIMGITHLKVVSGNINRLKLLSRAQDIYLLLLIVITFRMKQTK